MHIYFEIYFFITVINLYFLFLFRLKLKGKGQANNQLNFNYQTIPAAQKQEGVTTDMEVAIPSLNALGNEDLLTHVDKTELFLDNLRSGNLNLDSNLISILNDSSLLNDLLSSVPPTIPQQPLLLGSTSNAEDEDAGKSLVIYDNDQTISNFLQPDINDDFQILSPSSRQSRPPKISVSGKIVQRSNDDEPLNTPRVYLENETTLPFDELN